MHCNNGYGILSFAFTLVLLLLQLTPQNPQTSFFDTGTFLYTDCKRYASGTREFLKAGSDLAEGYFGLLCQLVGDLDYLAKWLQVPRWSNHSKPCCICKCTFKGTMSWLDCRPNSPWQASTLEASIDWKTHWTSSAEIFDLPGGACLLEQLAEIYVEPYSQSKIILMFLNFTSSLFSCFKMDPLIWLSKTTPNDIVATQA